MEFCAILQNEPGLARFTLAYRVYPSRMRNLNAGTINSLRRCLDLGAVFILTADDLHGFDVLRSRDNRAQGGGHRGRGSPKYSHPLSPEEIGGGVTPSFRRCALRLAGLRPERLVVGGQVNVQNRPMIHEFSLP